MAFSGILYMGAMLFYLQALQSEEASVVAPFFQAAPLFAYLLGYIFLGEALSPRQLAGGGLGTRYALLLAPLSLVQAVGSTTTLFVFVIGIALSICCPALGRETIARRDLMRKGGSALLVTAGVILVSS
jgi:EamA-like transporter family